MERRSRIKSGREGRLTLLVGVPLLARDGRTTALLPLPFSELSYLGITSHLATSPKGQVLAGIGQECPSCPHFRLPSTPTFVFGTGANSLTRPWHPASPAAHVVQGGDTPVTPLRVITLDLPGPQARVQEHRAAEDREVSMERPSVNRPAIALLVAGRGAASAAVPVPTHLGLLPMSRETRGGPTIPSTPPDRSPSAFKGESCANLPCGDSARGARPPDSIQELVARDRKEEKVEDTMSQDESNDWPSPAEQQEVIERGLRILARVAVRAHLRRQGLLADTGAVTEAGEGPSDAVPTSRQEEENAGE